MKTKYVAVTDENGAPHPDMVVCADGVELRRAPTDDWAAYEAFLATGGRPQRKFTRRQWAALNDNARRRLRELGPG